MSYIFFSLLAAFCFGMGTISSKLASKHTLKSWEQLWVYFIVCFSILPPLFILITQSISLPSDGVIAIILNSLFFVVALGFFFKALFSVDASVATPLFQIQSAVIAVLAYLFLGERFPSVTYLWLLIIIIGAVIVSLDEKLHLTSFLRKEVLFMVGANLLFGVSNLFSGIALKHEGFANSLFWTPLVNILLVGIFVAAKRPKLSVPFPAITPMIAGGFFQFVGVTSLLRAYEQNLTISGVLGLLSAPMVFIISIISSRFFPNLLEHHSAKVYAIRAVGLIIILFSAIKLATY